MCNCDELEPQNSLYIDPLQSWLSSVRVKSWKMSQKQKQQEEDTVEKGDLGLGRGLKPGAIERTEEDGGEFNPRDIALLRHAQSAMARSASIHSLDNFDGKYTSFPILDGHPKSKIRIPKLGLRWLRRSKSDCQDLSLSTKFPEYADVPLGTSFRQQRELYLQQMKELFPDLYVEESIEETSEPDSPRDKGKAALLVGFILN